MYIYCGCVLVKGCTFSEGSRGIEKGCCCCIERIFMRVVPEWKGNDLVNINKLMVILDKAV